MAARECGVLVAIAATAAAAPTAAAAVSATATTAAATTVTTAAAATTAAATGAVFAGLGFIDREGPAVMLLAVKGGDCRLGLGIRAHLNESETLAAAGLAVGNDFGGLHGTVLSEQLLQVRARRVVAQVPDV